MIEVADLTFAMDSIPAIFSVTQDAFIIFHFQHSRHSGIAVAVFSAGARHGPIPLPAHPALAVILMFIGARMLFAPWVHIPTAFALVGIVLNL